MTHYTVTVCAARLADLEHAMAPYDENLPGCEHPHWDWWVIGGRWAGRFPVNPGMDHLTHTEHSPYHDPAPPGTCDAGPIRALSLTQMREQAATAARAQHRQWEQAVDGTPDALPWRVYRDNISEGNGYTLAQAREEYNAQPRVQAYQASGIFTFTEDPIDEFQNTTAETRAAHAAAAAVPGYATLTLDGRWLAPGDMGWWGISTDTEPDRIGYWEVANAYITQLPEDIWLINVDAHI
jgi:hypothetical protein